MDWNALIKLAGPAAGMFAGNPSAQAAFSNRWRENEARDQAEQDKQRQLTERKKVTGADFLMKIGEHANTLDDPLALDQFLSLAEEAGTQAGYVQPGQLKGRFSVPESRIQAKQLKALTTQLDALEKGGYDLDELANSGQHVSVGGQPVPIASAMQITNRRPLAADGTAIPKPKKADAAPPTDYARFLARYAQGKGVTVDKLTAADELDAKKQYGQADDKPVTAPLGSEVQQQFNDLLALWKQKNPGKDAGPDITSQLRIQAKKDIGQADDKAPTPGGTGADDARRFNMEQRLATTWTNATKSTREMQRQFSLMKTGLKRFHDGDKNGGSQAVLVTFQKILDPTSVVRESEYARSASGISALGRLEGYFDKLRSGGAGVPEAELTSMVKTAQDMLNDMGQFTDGTRRRVNASVKHYKLDPAAVFDDALIAPDEGPQMPDAQPDAKASAAAKLSKRK